MDAIKFETMIDETVAGAMPQLRPLLGRRVEVIALDTVKAPADHRQTSFDDFLAHRLKRPADVDPVSLDDMERAIGGGAVGADR